MYTSPDFVKVAVKVEDSFAAYECTTAVVKGFITIACETATGFTSMLDGLPADKAYQCWVGKHA